MAEHWYCANKHCPYQLKRKEAFSQEFLGDCPTCGEKLTEG